MFTKINIVMAHISIIGDSWGYPLLGGDYPASRYTPADHTENQLRDVYGYKVRNYSMGGISNLDSIRRISNNLPRVCDLIIWFGTEAFRDFDACDRPFGVDRTIQDAMSVAYAGFERVRKRLDADCILIGGQAPLHSARKGIVNRVVYEIEDWRAELLGEPNLEGSHLLCHPYIFESEGIQDSAQRKVELITSVNTWLDLMNGHTHFPDDCHPGGAAHRSLAMRLHKIIHSHYGA